MPWDWERLTPADLEVYLEGRQAALEEQYWIAAWVIAHLVNGVARKLDSPVNLMTLLPEIYAKRVPRRKD